MRLFAFLQSGIRSLSKALSRFPVVILFLIGIFVLTCIQTATHFSINFERELTVLAVMCFLSLAVTFPAEKSQSVLRTGMIFQSAVILAAVLYELFLYYGGYNSSRELIRAVSLGAVFLLAAMFLPSFICKSDFNRTFLSYFKALFTTVFFVGIAFGGITAILAAVDNLLFRLAEETYSYVSNFMLILVAPIVLLSLLPSFGKPGEEERDQHLSTVPGFLRILLTYVLIPLSGIYTVVLLLYIVKTILSGDTEGILYPMILTYCVSVVILYVLTGDTDKKIYKFYRAVFPKLMGLIALYQGIRIIMRIAQEGLLPESYYALLFTTFSLAAGIVTSILPVKRNVILPVILSGLLALSVIGPIGPFSLSSISQSAVVASILEKNQMLDAGSIRPNPDLSATDRQKIRSALMFLEEAGELHRVAGLPESFAYWSDFNDVFGFPAFDADDGGVKEIRSFSYTHDSSKPIDVDADTFAFRISASNGMNLPQTMTGGTFEKDKKTYQLLLHPGSTTLDLEVTGPDGTQPVVLSVSEFVQTLRAKEGDMRYNLETEAMTASSSSANLEIRVVFVEINGTQSGGDVTLSTDMLVFVHVIK